MKYRQSKASKTGNRVFREHGERLLKQADDILEQADLLDTAVRDEVAQGLGHLVHAAYDSIANTTNINETTAWMAFIDNATAEWFRDRGFAEWFCLACAASFNTSRPRTLKEIRSVQRKVFKVVQGKPTSTKRLRRATSDSGKSPDSDNK